MERPPSSGEPLGDRHAWSIEPLAPHNLVDLLNPCLSCARWELGDDLTDTLVPTGVADPALEKEAWLTELLSRDGNAGLLARDGSGRTVGHIVVAPPRLVGRTLPTSPAGDDALLVVSLVVTGRRRGTGLSDALVGRAAEAAARTGRRALEAFAVATDPAGEPPACLLPERALVRLGFRVVAPHATVPRLRLDTPWLAEASMRRSRPARARRLRQHDDALATSVTPPGRSAELLPQLT